MLIRKLRINIRMRAKGSVFGGVRVNKLLVSWLFMPPLLGMLATLAATIPLIRNTRTSRDKINQEC
jgi:hypothetical protein